MLKVTYVAHVIFVLGGSVLEHVRKAVRAMGIKEGVVESAE